MVGGGGGRAVPRGWGVRCGVWLWDHDDDSENTVVGRGQGEENLGLDWDCLRPRSWEGVPGPH